MKQLLLIFFLGFIFNSAVGQIDEIINKIDKIKTVEEANKLKFIHIDSITIMSRIISIDPNIDTTDVYKKALSTAPGELIKWESDDKNYVYVLKSIGWREALQFRVSHIIFFESDKLNIKQIENNRKVILNRLKKGEKFEDLAKEYSMDGTAGRGGDLGWFIEGAMIKPFEDAIRLHKKGEVFVADSPREGWYFVIKITENPRKIKVLDALDVWLKNNK